MDTPWTGMAGWDLYNNIFEKTPVAAGIRKHYLDHPEHLTLDEYLLHEGLTHSMRKEV